jgi:hypothetical protein
MTRANAGAAPTLSLEENPCSLLAFILHSRLNTQVV